MFSRSTLLQIAKASTKKPYNNTKAMVVYACRKPDGFLQQHIVNLNNTKCMMSTSTSTVADNITTLIAREEISAREAGTEENLSEAVDVKLLQKYKEMYNLVEKRNSHIVTMETKYKNENITIEAMAQPEWEELPLEGKELNNAKAYFESQGVEYNEEDLMETNLLVPLSVFINKGEETLKINLIAHSKNGFHVDTLAFCDSNKKATDTEDDMFISKFRDYPDDLQDGIFNYLEERGINGDFAEFITIYAFTKEKGNYLDFLGDFQKYFLKKPEV